MHSNFKQLHSFGAEVSSKEMQHVPRIVKKKHRKVNTIFDNPSPLSLLQGTSLCSLQFQRVYTAYRLNRRYVAWEVRLRASYIQPITLQLTVAPCATKYVFNIEL